MLMEKLLVINSGEKYIECGRRGYDKYFMLTLDKRSDNMKEENMPSHVAVNKNWSIAQPFT